jgi:hypothetical protein
MKCLLVHNIANWKLQSYNSHCQTTADVGPSETVWMRYRFCLVEHATITNNNLFLSLVRHPGFFAVTVLSVYSLRTIRYTLSDFLETTSVLLPSTCNLLLYFYMQSTSVFLHAIYFCITACNTFLVELTFLSLEVTIRIFLATTKTSVLNL